MSHSNFKKLVALHEELFRRGKKLCTRCLEIKNLEEYYKDNRVRLGLRPMCHFCELEYYHKKSRLFRLKHPQKNDPMRIIKT